jgi:hypothetical protein
MPRTKTVKKSLKSAAATARKKTKKSRPFDFFAEIQKRAYEIYLERTEKQTFGDQISDWVQAERDIKLKHGE